MKTTPTTRINRQSYDAAQAKVWRAERMDLLKAAKKVMADFHAENRRLIKAMRDAEKAHTKFHRQARPKMDRACAAIDRRIGILNGKLGL